MTEQELKNFVYSLADSHKKTAKILEEAAMLSKETKEQFKETEKLLKETSQEADKRFKEIGQNIDRVSKLQEKNEKKIDKLHKVMKSLRKLGINIGFSVEEFFYECFNSHRTMGNLQFDDVSHNVKGRNYEFDIVLYNDHSIGIIEIKHRLRPNDIGKFTKKIQKFKEEFPQYNDFKIYAGVASYSFERQSDSIAQEGGLFTFSRRGQKIKTLNKKNFEARVF